MEGDESCNGECIAIAPVDIQQTRSRLGNRGGTSAVNEEAGSVGQMEKECGTQP